MATCKDIGFKNYCDNVYTELTGMKSRLLDLVKNIETKSVPEVEHLKSHVPHLLDIVNTIDWKLGIIMRVCPADWKGFTGEFETAETVSVQETGTEREFVAGGYVGG